MATQAFVGCSGWHYEHWRGTFYPAHLSKSQWLLYYVTHFRTVELNNTFYRLPTPSAVEKWAACAPPGFLFSVKGSRYVTHILRLRECGSSVETFCGRVQGLGLNLGPLLWQLPPSLRRDDALLSSFLSVLPPSMSHTIEFRHSSWWVSPIYEMMRRCNIAFCIYDMEATRTPVVRTADFVYVRFHGPDSRYGGRYADVALSEWATSIRQLGGDVKQVFAYFNNDANAFAVQNADTFRTLLVGP